MRADKFLYHNARLGRKAARKKIDRGLLLVNDVPVTEYTFPIDKFDLVILEDEVLQSHARVYIMLHKPPGYICATEDKENHTVMELLSEQKEELHIVGRLDKYTTGLVLLTNDGKWSRRISEPSSKKEKTYILEAENVISNEMIEAFESGVYFEKEGVTSQPAIVKKLGEKSMQLTIFEGMHHQIKRMLLKFENRVTKLHRTSVAGITLDISEGEWRCLSEAEVIGL